MDSIKNSQEAQDLQQLVNGANNYLQSTELLNSQPVPRVNHTQHLGAGERKPDERKMDDRQPLPRVGQPTTRDIRTHNNGPPASRTRSKKKHQTWKFSGHKSKGSTKTQRAKVIETHSENGKWSPRSSGGNGHGNRQGIKLLAADATTETERNME